MRTRTRAAAAVIAGAIAIGVLAPPSGADPVPVAGTQVTSYDIAAPVLRIAVDPDGDRVYLATAGELLVRDAQGAPLTSILVPDLVDVATTADQVILLTRTATMRQVIRLDGDTLVEEERTNVDYGPTGGFTPDLTTPTFLTVSGRYLWWGEDEPQMLGLCNVIGNQCEHMLWRFDLETSLPQHFDVMATTKEIVAADEIVVRSDGSDGVAKLREIGPENYYPPYTGIDVDRPTDLALAPDGHLIALGSGGAYELARPGFATTGVTYSSAGAAALDVAPTGMVALGSGNLDLYRSTGGAAASSVDLDPGNLAVVPDQLRFSPDGQTVYAVLGSSGDPRATGGRKLAVVPVAEPDLGPFSDVSSFLGQQYGDALARPATPAEEQAARHALATGVRPGAVIAPLIQAESAANPDRAAIIRLYQAAFLRPPDRSGLDYWLRRFRSGMKLTQIAANFAGSSEFQRRYGTLGNAEFVKQIFLNVFGRTVDPSGLAYWTGRLDAGRSRGIVLAQWSESSEYVRKMAGLVEVTALYLVMLDRMPTGQEWADARAALAGGTTLADGADGMLRSERYATRIAS